MRSRTRLVLGAALACVAWAVTAMAATEAEKLNAIENALNNLYVTQQPGGYWNYGGYEQAATGAAAFALLSQRNKWGASAAEYQSAADDAIGFLLSTATIITVGARDDGYNPCGTGTCAGVYWDGAGEPTYTTGLVAPAIAAYAAGRASEVATTTGPLADLTWGQIAQGVTNLFAASQTTVTGGNRRGGWRYFPGENDSDSSTTQWAVISLIYDETLGATTPQFVKDELKHWLAIVQSDPSLPGAVCYQPGLNDPGTNPCEMSDTGGWLLGMRFVGYDRNNSQVQAALPFLNGNWTQAADALWYGNFGHPYAMWSVYKGLETIIGLNDTGTITSLLTTCGAPGSLPGNPPGSVPCNWVEDYNQWLVDNQNPDGSWTGYGHWFGPLATAFDLGILGAAQIPSGLVITVKDTAGAPVPGADVVVIDSDGTRFSAVTGSDGVAWLAGLSNGAHTVYAWAPGYLPEVAQATQVQGVGNVIITLRSGALAMTDLQSQRLTLEQIIDAGIDPNDPINQNVFQFEVHLAFSESGASGSLTGYIGGGDSGSQFIFPEAVGGTCTPGACTFSAGGNGSVAIGSPQVIEGQPSIFWLVIPGKASWLKEFFAIRTVVTNLASPQFSFTNGSATLSLPGGLSLAPTSAPQSLTVQMADIPGQSSGAAEWVIRGDVAGEYELSTTYSGVLDPFGRSVQFTAQTPQPIKVWGGNALEMIVDADDQAFRTYPYRVRVGLHNVTAADPTQATDVYNPAVELLNQGRLNFIWQPRQQMLFATAVIHPGDTFWTEDIIVVPSISGVLDVSASFVKKTAGNVDVASRIISHTPIQDPSTAPKFEVSGPGALAWEAVSGAEKYQVFETPAAAGADPFPTQDFPDAPVAETTDTWARISGQGSGRVWYGVSAVVGGRNVMFHPIILVCVGPPCPALDTVVPPLRPLNVVLRSGKPSVAKDVRVTVRNASEATQTIQLMASEGDCPAGTLAGLPDFASRTAGAQDTVTLTAGRSKTAVVPLSIDSAHFTNATQKAPTRCTLRFTANTLPADLSYDPTPANNTAILELSVSNATVPGGAPPHETYVRSVAPLSVSLRAGVSSVTKTARIKVGNGDIGETPGHPVSVTVSDGDCPAGTVGAVDLDARLPGAQDSVTVRGGRTKVGALTVTINADAFSTPSGKAPARCTASIMAVGPAGDTDASNDATQLVIEVTDRNDF
jgi:hypothetical protein